VFDYSLHRIPYCQPSFFIGALGSSAGQNLTR
jgi:hypothetical protein